MTTPATLKEYYDSKGQTMPTWQERAPVYESLGLGKASEYVGNESQNVALLGKLVGGSSTTGGVSVTVVDPAAAQKEALISGKASTLNSGIASPVTPVVNPSTGLSNQQVNQSTNDLVAQANTMLAQTKAEGDKPFAGSSYDMSATPIVPPGLPGSGTEGGAVVSSDGARAKTSAELIEEAKKQVEEQRKQETEISSLSNAKTIADLKASLGITTPPVAPNLVSDYEALRSKEGVSAVESQISALDAQINDINATLTMGLHDESGKLRPMELISSRQQALKNQATEQLTELNNRKAVLVDQYNTKVSLISTIMGLKSTDYQNASAAYNTAFNQATTLQNALISQEDRAKSEANVVIDNARANLTVLQSSLKDSGKDWASLDDAMKTQIYKLELQANLPTGTIQAFMAENPDLKIDYTTTGYDDNGNQVVSFFSYNNGDPKLVKAITTKSTKQETEASPSEVASNAKTDMTAKLNAVVGDDFKVSPNDYKLYKSMWVDAGYSAQDYDDNFKGYIDSSHSVDYGHYNYYGTK